MAVALTKENFFWHKVHSLTGIIPVGFYMLQHLTLNSFSLGGPDKFNGVIHFFASMPKHFLLSLEIVGIWLPLLFHAVYGLFITSRAQPNYFSSKYGWSQNRMFILQRYSGILIFFFLIYHIITTTVAAKLRGEHLIEYAAWQQNLSSYGYAILALYLIGTLAASYHLAYGVWNFCIRWGITISEQAQARVQKFSFGMFIVVTGLAWAALAGFLLPRHGAEVQNKPSAHQVQNVSFDK